MPGIQARKGRRTNPTQERGCWGAIPPPRRVQSGGQQISVIWGSRVLAAGRCGGAAGVGEQGLEPAGEAAAPCLAQLLGAQGGGVACDPRLLSRRHRGEAPEAPVRGNKGYSRVPGWKMSRHCVPGPQTFVCEQAEPRERADVFCGVALDSGFSFFSLGSAPT